MHEFFPYKRTMCWRILCVWACVQTTMLCIMTIRHLDMTRTLRLDMMTLATRACVLLTNCSRHNLHKEDDGPSPAGIIKRGLADVRQLSRKLEAILERQCTKTSPLCLPGQDGDSGQHGCKGPPGLTGSVGQAGCKGHTGSSGSSGQPGTPGKQGVPGRQGMSGDRGKAGSKGNTGQVGTSGLRGSLGDPGGDGVTGEKGAKGDPGPRGGPGERGARGPSGSTGPGGLQGEKGRQSDAGVKGQPGPRRSCLCRLPPPQPRLISDCDFELNSCQWGRPATTYGWRRGNSLRQSDFSGPSTDHTLHSRTGHYMFTNAFFGLSEMTSQLTSHWLPGTKEYCLELWYFLHGRRAGSLDVRTQTRGQVTGKLWQITGDQGAAWRKTRLSVTSSEDFRFLLVARFGGHFTADVFIDDVNIFTGRCS